MDSETAFLFSHAVARGKNTENLAIIINGYEEYQKLCKSYSKATVSLGNTDRVISDVAISKYLELEKKLRLMLGENFSKAVKTFKDKEQAYSKLKSLIKESDFTKEELLELFPMLKEF